MGGGEYPRPRATTAFPAAKVYSVGAQAQDTTVSSALARWQADRAAGTSVTHVAIEILDSRIYAEDPAALLLAGERLEVRAADGARPVLRLSDRLAFDSEYAGEESGPPSLVLDGLTVAGGPVELIGEFDTVDIGHCTLVPTATGFLQAEDTVTRLAIRRSILGGLVLRSRETGPPKREPVELDVSDSIIDGQKPGHAVLTSGARGAALAYVYARLSMWRSTVQGTMYPYSVGIVENSICLGPLYSARRQQGCVRYSWLPTVSQTPVRYRCQPETAVGASPATSSEVLTNRTAPDFTSKTYGTPTYFQLSPRCPEEIRRGAEDGSEMGAYHDLFEPLRVDGLRARLDEYTPASALAGLIFVT
jgi:hypothetical protein